MKHLPYIIASTLVLLTSCTLMTESPEISTTPVIPRIIDTGSVHTGSSQSEARVGQIITSYTESDTYADIRTRYEKSGYLSGISELIHESIILPRDLPMSFDTCGEDNAFYDGENKSITICYEIVKMLEDKFGSTGSGQEMTQNALTFYTLHEVGHALVDILDLPITGREEDVADQMATFLLIGGKDGMILDAAESFYTDLSTIQVGDLPFEDVHSLDPQRFYNILCWTYGSDAKTYQYLVDDKLLPTDRAEGCEDEFVKLNNSFITLLGKNLKQ